MLFLRSALKVPLGRLHHQLGIQKNLLRDAALTPVKFVFTFPWVAINIPKLQRWSVSDG